MKRSGQTLASYTEEIRLYPQALLNVRVPAGFDWVGSPEIAAEKSAVEALLGATGRVLIRPSGTEPLLRVMVEAPDSVHAHDMAKRIADKVPAA